LKAIAEEAAKRVEHCAVALIPDTSDKKSPVASAEMLNWNPGSPIAAKTVVLAAENRLTQIDEAILVCAPPSLCKQPGQLNHIEIEALVNDEIKGWFLLIKELIANFRTRKAGTLALALSRSNAEVGQKPAADQRSATDLLAPSALASFQAFAQSLLAIAPAEPFQTLAFSPPDTSDDVGFAAFIFKIIEEGNKKNNARWHRFGKIGFFGR
jgi:hypothetical protein